MLIHRRPQGGAATVEFYLVALLALLPLCLGMVQMSLLLVANHHIDHAAFMAARAGAVHQGDIGAMRSEFARVMTPLFVDSSSPLDAGNVAARVASARIRAVIDMTTFSRIRVLSPGTAAMRDFAESRDGARVIPSDGLQHRSNAPGETSGISLQQANMLRVEFIYCRPLVVPFIRGLMIGLLRRLDPEPSNLRCYSAGRVPIRSTGTAPMQSDFIASATPGGFSSAPPPEIQLELQSVRILEEDLPQPDRRRIIRVVLQAMPVQPLTQRRIA